MSNTTTVLRKFKKEDLKNIGSCFEQKIIHIVCAKDPTPETVLQDYMDRSECNIALAIADATTDELLGGIDTYIIEDTITIFCYINQDHQSKGIATQALGEFLRTAKDYYPDAQYAAFSFRNERSASLSLAKKLGFVFSKENSNEYAQTWIKPLDV